MMKIVVDDKITIFGLPRNARKTVKKEHTLQNPDYVNNRRMGRWNGSTLQYLYFYKETDDGALILPRGAIRIVIKLLRGYEFQIIDNRRTLPEVDFNFHGSLRQHQVLPVRRILMKDFGTLSAATGSGKTIMALEIIAERGQPALIIVHTKELLYQWRNSIERFLRIPRNEIGIIGDGKKTIGPRITVAIVNTLYRVADRVAPYIGHLVVDECHRTPSRTFTEAVQAFDCRYMTGLSATPYRQDGLSPLIEWHLGPIRAHIDKAGLVETGNLVPAEVTYLKTDFQTTLHPSSEYVRVMSELCEDPQRNHLIARDVAETAQNGPGGCLVLSDRTGHCDALQEAIRVHGAESAVLTGQVTKLARESIVRRLRAGEIKVLIATGQLIGEGFDCAALSNLFIATPVRSAGRLTQYLGRVLRPSPGKTKARVFDYVDHHVGPLRASAAARKRVYEKQHSFPGGAYAA